MNTFKHYDIDWKKSLIKQEDELFEFFHVNTFTDAEASIGSLKCFQNILPDENNLLQQIMDFEQSSKYSLSYDSETIIKLDKNYKQKINNNDLYGNILNRKSCRNKFKKYNLSLINLNELLFFAYGEVSNQYRTVPSGGKLYPLEIYAFVNTVENVEVGIYHYNPHYHELHLINPTSIFFQEVIVDKNILNQIESSSVCIIITSIFKKSTIKYGNRGYRHVLLEAGHVAQNINLVCTQKNLEHLNISGFSDNKLHELLGINGVDHAALYAITIGKAEIE